LIGLDSFYNLIKNTAGTREGQMAIHPALVGHGMFTEYSITNALTRLANYGAGAPATTPPERIARFVKAMQDMDVRTVWIQLFTRGTKFDMDTAGAKLRKDLIAALGNANINWAGWGYCAGKNSARDKTWISDLRDDLGMKAFVIDAEPEAKDDKDVWTEDDFESFVIAQKKLFGVDNLALSTWPVLQIREKAVTKLMKLAAPHVSLFAPQAYWMSFPSKVHYNSGFSKETYPPNDPTSYVRLVIDSWALAGIATPLVVTGQLYWESKTPSKTKMKERWISS
jgi:hypothetical protein